MRWVLPLLLIPFSFTSLAAQDTLTSGDKVRVTTKEERVVGSMVSLKDNRLRLRTEDPDTSLVLPFASVTKLEVSRGQESSVGRDVVTGAVIFGAIGGTLGGLFWALCAADPPSDDCWKGLPAGIAIGAGVGSLLGLAYWAAESDVLPKPVSWGFGGLLFGAIVGGTLGAAADSQADEAIREGEEPNPCADADCALVGAAVLGGVGMVLGVVAGFSTGSDEVDEAKLDRLRVHILAQPDRVGLMASVSF